MQKFVTTMFAVILMMILAGCGGGGKAAATTVLPKTIVLTPADVESKGSFFSVPPNATSNDSIVNYTLDQQHLGASPPTQPNTWNISTTGATTGAIIFIDAGGVQHTFTCIQKESAYWLFFDENNKISRFYFDQTSAQNYLSSILSIFPSSTPFKNFTGAKLGGSVQGIALPSVFTNVTTAAGSQPGAGGTVGTPGGANGKGTAASFNHPFGITTDGINLYVADNVNNIIRKVDITTLTVTKLAGSPTPVVINGLSTFLAGNTDSTDGTGDTALFNRPAGITTDGINLYVADFGNNMIRKVDPTSGAVTLVAGSTTSVAGSVDALHGTDARFNQPTGITTDGTNLYVADSGNHIIRKIVISSGAVVTLAGISGSPGSNDSTDGTGATARFNQPAGITTDGTNLYVADLKNSTIRKIVIATGQVTTLAGSAGTIGNTNGTGTAARFNQPNGITTDGTNLYVTDSSVINNLIRKIVISSGAVTTIAGTAIDESDQKVPTYVNTAGSSLPDPNSTTGQPLGVRFNGPTGITTDGKSLYVVDSLNNAIRRIQ